MTESPDNPAFTDPSVRIVWSSFLVRLYREGENGAWRGEILHLQTQEKRFFATLAQLNEFLTKHAPGVSAP